MLLDTSQQRHQFIRICSCKYRQSLIGSPILASRRLDRRMVDWLRAQHAQIAFLTKRPSILYSAPVIWVCWPAYEGASNGGPISRVCSPCRMQSCCISVRIKYDERLMRSPALRRSTTNPAQACRDCSRNHVVLVHPCRNQAWRYRQGSRLR